MLNSGSGGATNSGVFSMSDGMITDNTANYGSGGGVYNELGVFNLSGNGMVANNTASQGDGDVYNG